PAAGPGDIESKLIRPRSKTGIVSLKLRKPEFGRMTAQTVSPANRSWRIMNRDGGCPRSTSRGDAGSVALKIELWPRPTTHIIPTVTSNIARSDVGNAAWHSDPGQGGPRKCISSDVGDSGRNPIASKPADRELEQSGSGLVE